MISDNISITGNTTGSGDDGCRERDLPVALVHIPDREFLLPYFRRELQDTHCVVTDAIDVPDGVAVDMALMVSSTDIYNVTSGEMLDETTPALTTGLWHDREAAFADDCRRLGVRPVVVRCPHVVGTGMNGLPMRMARGIARGMLMHIKGNEGRLSVVHAVDVARLGTALCQTGVDGPVILTDGTETTVDALIDALAFRIKDKTVFTIRSQRVARLLYGSDYYGQLTRTLTFSNARTMEALGDGVEPPVTVTDYLRTHVYDDSSL